MLADFAKHLLDLNLGQATADKVLAGLMLPNYALSPDLDKNQVKRASRTWRDDEGNSATDLGEDDEDEDEDEDGADFEPARPALPHENGLIPEADLQEAEADQASAGLAEKDVPATGYVISKTCGGRCRRLHFVEACRLVPGWHYTDFEVWGEILPPEHEVSAVCKICLKNGLAGAVESPAEMSEGSTSSSSGREPEPAAKKAKTGIADQSE